LARHVKHPYTGLEESRKVVSPGLLIFKFLVVADESVLVSSLSSLGG
jgi:hypothetical protein